MRPRLPGTASLLPYLREIERTRIYSNFGPLCRRFAARVEDALALPAGSVVPTGSGTGALCAAILAATARRRPERTLAVVPAMTFVATAIAAERCGLRPLLADVDGATWSLDAERLLGHPRLAEVAVVVPVAPYGRAVPQAPWRRFSEATGIPVVIDAAASFSVIEGDPGAHLGPVPTALSFHATKSLGIGEGGCVACTDPALAAAAACATNFGFFGSRDSIMPSLNSKMSEFHAAVGLAALEAWPLRCQSLMRVALAYGYALPAATPRVRLHAAPAIDMSYVLLECDGADLAAATVAALAECGIDTRFWYGAGVGAHRHFAGWHESPTPVADRLCACLVGLPCYDDLSNDDIRRICDTIRNVAAGTGAAGKSAAGKNAPGKRAAWAGAA